MKVAIATGSREKIAGIKEAFLRFFQVKESELQIYSAPVESGVPEQPFDEQTYQGALNRVNGIQEVFPDMDFYISCEAGIEYAFYHYFNVQVVCILDGKSKDYFWGKSAGLSIPAEAIEEIRQRNLDNYLRGKGITCIQELLGENNSRRAAVAQATEFALASGKLSD